MKQEASVSQLEQVLYGRIYAFLVPGGQVSPEQLATFECFVWMDTP